MIVNCQIFSDFPDHRVTGRCSVDPPRRPGHWGIENQLHWHLDVTFHEDACRTRKGFAAQNLSTVRKLALQILKAHNDKKSIRKRIFSAALSQHYLFDVLLNAKI